MRALPSRLALAAIVTTLAARPGTAQERMRPDRATGPAAAETYDETTMGRLPTPPGGVPGNAPFNNQIRKHTAPFEASGSGR